MFHPVISMVVIHPPNQNNQSRDHKTEKSQPDIFTVFQVLPDKDNRQLVVLNQILQSLSFLLHNLTSQLPSLTHIKHKPQFFINPNLQFHNFNKLPPFHTIIPIHLSPHPPPTHNTIQSNPNHL
jgi:hypothetical protein